MENNQQPAEGQNNINSQEEQPKEQSKLKIQLFFIILLL